LANHYSAIICYIRYMPNIANKTMRQVRERFIQGMAQILVPWGVPQTAARLYGYLLLSDEPVSLDRIVTDLEISKSTASVAARLLVTYTLVRRTGQRGTRRVLFEASDDFNGMLNAQKRASEQLAALIKEGAQTTSSRRTRERLRTMAEFYLLNRDAMESAQRDWAARSKKT
jgi:DNA-binding transcriptional regulator GbsR (MarR family)